MSEEQIQAWADLAAAHTEQSLTENGCALTGQNLYMCINYNRELLEVPMVKEAPEDIHGSRHVYYDDIWLTPSAFIISGIKDPVYSNSRIVVKIAGPTSRGVSNYWGYTAILGTAFDSDWGELNLTSAYRGQYNKEIVAGKKYFIEMYWIDPYCGYVAEVTRISLVASESESAGGETYVPRAAVATENVVNTEQQVITDLLYEVATADRIVVDDFSSIRYSGNVSSVNMTLENVRSDEVVGPYVYQFARGNADQTYPYLLSFNMLYISKSKDEYTFSFVKRGGTFQNEFETFGTFQSFNL